jgi:predicted phosphodiesterase
MKFAVLSDIHGNLEALEAVLEEIQCLDLDAVISLGDNIGYGPDSQAVVDLIRDREIESVLGNHEMALKRKSALAWFNPMAKQALAIARSQLSDAAMDWIERLPPVIIREGLRFVHGVPPAAMFLYLFQVPENKLIQKLIQSVESVCFVGHTHDLGIISWDGHRLDTQKPSPGTHILDPAKKYIINAGSVGQPRDGTPEAKFLLYDTTARRLTVRARQYPFEKTQGKIIAAGIPQLYADRLAMGAGPSGSKGTDK